MGSEVGNGEMVTSFREGGLPPPHMVAAFRGPWGQEGGLGGPHVHTKGPGHLPVLHMSLESLGHMQELAYSYEECLRNAYSM